MKEFLFSWFWSPSFYEPVKILKVNSWNSAEIQNDFGLMQNVTMKKPSSWIVHLVKIIFSPLKVLL